MNKRKGRLGVMLARVDSLTRSMQTFCLDPGLKLFKEISCCETIKRREADDFKAWRLACLYKYGSDWGLTHDPDDSNKSIELAETAFVLFENSLCGRAIDEPSRSKSLQILHLFFATGELKYIDLFYQCMGHEKLHLDTRRYLANVYSTVKELYRENVAKYLAVDKDHFIKLELSEQVLDFTYIDKAVAAAREAKDKIAEQNKILASAGARPVKPDYLQMPDKLYGIDD